MKKPAKASEGKQKTSSFLGFPEEKCNTPHKRGSRAEKKRKNLEFLKVSAAKVPRGCTLQTENTLQTEKAKKHRVFDGSSPEMMTGPANFEQLKNSKKPRVFEPWSSEMMAGPAKTKQNTNRVKLYRV